MTRPTDIGTNRTGAATSPIKSVRSKKVARSATPAEPDTGEQEQLIEDERIAWSSEASPVGTVPPPGTLKGMAKTALEVAAGHQPTVFIDKLGERLAFERTGARLYDALLAKLEVASVHEGGPTRDELVEIRDDERRHVLVVTAALKKLGADPTAMTPSADIMGVASLGWVQVLTDPRTTLTQCLEVILVAELADTDGWTVLHALAQSLGFDDLATEFAAALEEEERHLALVRQWVAIATLGQAGVVQSSA